MEPALFSTEKEILHRIEDESEPNKAQIGEVVKSDKTSQMSDLQVDSASEVWRSIAFKGFYEREPWDTVELLPARVISKNEAHVVCDCILDEDSRCFSVIEIPVDFVRHIQNLTTDKLLMIKISTKAGSIRHDYYDAIGFGVRLEDFDDSKEWDDLRGDFPMDDYSK
jgi:hypothetical protein